MAAEKSIGASSDLAQVSRVYEERLLELVELVKSYDQLAQAMEEAAGDSLAHPSWLWILQRHLERFQAASDGLLAAFHELRRPVCLIAG